MSTADIGKVSNLSDLVFIHRFLQKLSEKNAKCLFCLFTLNCFLQGLSFKYNQLRADVFQFRFHDCDFC